MTEDLELAEAKKLRKEVVEEAIGVRKLRTGMNLKKTLKNPPQLPLLKELRSLLRPRRLRRLRRLRNPLRNLHVS